MIKTKLKEKSDPLIFDLIEYQKYNNNPVPLQQNLTRKKLLEVARWSKEEQQLKPVKVTETLQTPMRKPIESPELSEQSKNKKISPERNLERPFSSDKIRSSV